MSNGFSYFYRIECFGGYKDNQIFEHKTFGGLYQKFKGTKRKPAGRELSDFIEMYDSGSTNAYYRIQCVFVHPNGEEKIIYTCEGLE